MRLRSLLCCWAREEEGTVAYTRDTSDPREVLRRDTSLVVIDRLPDMTVRACEPPHTPRLHAPQASPPASKPGFQEVFLLPPHNRLVSVDLSSPGISRSEYHTYSYSFTPGTVPPYPGTPATTAPPSDREKPTTTTQPPTSTQPSTSTQSPEPSIPPFLFVPSSPPTYSSPRGTSASTTSTSLGATSTTSNTTTASPGQCALEAAGL